MRTVFSLTLAVLVLAGPAFAADPAEALCECAKTAVACGGPECTCAKVREGDQCPLHRGKAAKGSATGQKQPAPVYSTTGAPKTGAPRSGAGRTAN